MIKTYYAFKNITHILKNKNNITQIKKTNQTTIQNSVRHLDRTKLSKEIH